MNDRRRIQAAFAAAEEFSDIEVFSTLSNEVSSGGYRLEGAFYGNGGYRAKRSMARAGFPTKRFEDLADIYWPGHGHSYEDLRRTYVDDESAGIPFLSTSEMLLARFEEMRFVSKFLSSHFDDLLVQPGCILVSRSGTIGRAVVATSDFANKYVSDDALRVKARQVDFNGLLFAFIQSDAGQFIITRSKSGGVVEHIYVKDLASLEVPLLPKALRCELTRLIDHTCDLRVRANQLLDDAEDEVYRQNYIPKPTSRGEESDAEVFRTSAKALFTEYEGKERIRLDATFQERAAVAAAAAVAKCKTHRKLIETVAAIPFTGPGSVPGVSKVEKGHGVPYVTSRDLGLARMRPAAHVASVKKKLIEDMHPPGGTTLIMCAGTLGRTFYVRDNFEKWAVSLDVIRVIPDKEKLHPGYVYSFLSSQLGKAQMLRHKYGSVIPRIHSRQVAEVLIPIPTDLGESIASLVDESARCRFLAREAEDRAIKLFESAIERGRAYTEAEWGSEY